MAELQRHAGRQFDPELVRILRDLVAADPQLLSRLLDRRVTNLAQHQSLAS